MDHTFLRAEFYFARGRGGISHAHPRQNHSRIVVFFSRAVFGWRSWKSLGCGALGWEFNFDYHNVGVGVLWAIGWGMVVLSLLVWLPSGVVALFGVLMICLHNLFDGVPPEAFGKFGWLWAVLHVSTGLHPAPGFNFAIGYPLVPWMGVLAAGYGLGTIFLVKPVERERWMRHLGLSLIVVFVLIRALNGYGNPRAWQPQNNLLFTVFAFIDVHKYPPSLDFLLITIGPALVLLSYFDKGTPRLLRPLLVFGRVPLFYYLLHRASVRQSRLFRDRERVEVRANQECWSLSVSQHRHESLATDGMSDLKPNVLQFCCKFRGSFLLVQRKFRLRMEMFVQRIELRILVRHEFLHRRLKWRRHGLLLRCIEASQNKQHCRNQPCAGFHALKPSDFRAGKQVGKQVNSMTALLSLRN
jgi:uncharacterized membrane protein